MTKSNNSELEIWKSIEGFPGYQVSSLGRVLGPRSLLKAQEDRDGYLGVKLHIDGVGYFRRVSRLVCQAFNGSPPSREHQALHRDDNRSKNTPDNLFWGTTQDNSQDMVKKGRSLSNEDHPMAIMNWDDVRKIRQEYIGGRRIVDISLEHRVSTTCIGNIVHNRTWKDPEYVR